MARSLLNRNSMTPRMKAASPKRITTTAPVRGMRAARERWIAPHDPTLRERLEVAAAHLRLARRGAAAGLASAFLKREVELAGREIFLARRTLRSARAQAYPRDAAQIRMLELVSRVAADLQRSARAAGRLLAGPIDARP